jgi:hypothetical protein
LAVKPRHEKSVHRILESKHRNVFYHYTKRTISMPAGKKYSNCHGVEGTLIHVKHEPRIVLSVCLTTKIGNSRIPGYVFCRFSLSTCRPVKNTRQRPALSWKPRASASGSHQVLPQAVSEEFPPVVHPHDFGLRTDETSSFCGTPSRASFGCRDRQACAR